ncbi:glycoside hydrolase, partial [Candidatus Woesearchaeota archaeon]
MKTINFLFVVHFHQPYGQLQSVLDRVYQRCYLKWINMIKEYSEFKFAIHISGPLLYYLSLNYPAFIQHLLGLLNNGNLEIIGGAYSEAILPLLPREDRIEQVKRYWRIARRILGVEPHGFWLPERVWEPSLAEDLSCCGVDYVLLDDEHLKRAGISNSRLFYAYYTEEGGHKIIVLPINSTLRYLIPWKSPHDVITYLRNIASEDYEKMVLFITDAEKFGE